MKDLKGFPGHFQVSLILFSIFLMIQLTLASACADLPRTSETSTLESTPIVDFNPENAQGGNLLYQNLVLTIGKQIYFTSFDGQLCKANPDGSNVQVLAAQTAGNLTSDGSMLYYTDNRPTGNLNKISLDGTNQVRIGNTALISLIYAQNRLYAIEAASRQAVSLKPDGTGREPIIAGQTKALLFDSGNLFICGVEDAIGLVQISLNTGKMETLIQQKIHSPNIQDGWLYYADPSNEFQLCAWSFQDKKSWLISQLHLEKPFIVSQGYLYFIHSGEQNRLYRIPVNGRQNLNRLIPELIVDDAIGSFVVCDDSIYYQRANSRRIFIIPVTGGLASRIT